MYGVERSNRAFAPVLAVQRTDVAQRTDLGRNNFADSDEKPSDGDCGLSCSAAVASAVAAAAALNTTLKNSLELFWPQIRQWPIGR